MLLSVLSGFALTAVFVVAAPNWPDGYFQQGQFHYGPQYVLEPVYPHNCGQTPGDSHHSSTKEPEDASVDSETMTQRSPPTTHELQDFDQDNVVGFKGRTNTNTANGYNPNNFGQQPVGVCGHQHGYIGPQPFGVYAQQHGYIGQPSVVVYGQQPVGGYGYQHGYIGQQPVIVYDQQPNGVHY